MNEYLINIEECCTGTKIHIDSPDDVEYDLTIVNAGNLSDHKIKQIIKELVFLCEGAFLSEDGDSVCK